MSSAFQPDGFQPDGFQIGAQASSSTDIFPAPQYVKHFPKLPTAALAFIVVNLLTNTLAPAQAQDPFKPNDFPNPRIAKRIQVEPTQNLLLTTLAPQIPQGKQSLEIPIRPVYRIPDAPQNLRLTLLAPRIPPGQSSTVVPIRPVHRIEDPQRNNLLTILAPVSYTHLTLPTNREV